MLGGHSARRKSINHVMSISDCCTGARCDDILGGPEMYRVARRALTAGLPGKRTEKTREVKLVVSGVLARLCSLRDSTRGHFFTTLADTPKE